MKLRFCYRISAEANLAHDIITEEPAAAYMQLSMDAKTYPDNYEEAHNTLGAAMGKWHGINPEWIVPISESEYDLNMDEDDEVASDGCDICHEPHWNCQCN